jgi:flagellar basal-body rod protein FlgC
MSMFAALEISGSAMEAERQRAEVVAANMANAETTRTPSGGPYHRKQVVFSSSGNSPFQMMLAGFRRLTGRSTPAVRVARVINDPTPNVMRYEPGHPDADAKGYVAYPAINPIAEMVDLMGAVRSYQLNAAAVSATKQMIQGSMDILK